METILMAVWAVTAPMLVWSRWNGPEIIFDMLLAINSLSGFIFLLKVKD